MRTAQSFDLISWMITITSFRFFFFFKLITCSISPVGRIRIESNLTSLCLDLLKFLVVLLPKELANEISKPYRDGCSKEAEEMLAHCEPGFISPLSYASAYARRISTLSPVSFADILRNLWASPREDDLSFEPGWDGGRKVMGKYWEIETQMVEGLNCDERVQARMMVENPREQLREQLVVDPLGNNERVYGVGLHALDGLGGTTRVGPNSDPRMVSSWSTVLCFSTF